MRRSSFKTKAEAEAYAKGIRKYSKITREYVKSIEKTGNKRFSKYIVITYKKK